MKTVYRSLISIISLCIATIGCERISQQKCMEYTEMLRKTVLFGTLSFEPKIHTIDIDQCDPGQGLIVGGTNAKAGEFPHMVAIGYKDANGVVTFEAAGSLISERHVLTAAQVYLHNRVRPSVVRLGDLNLKLKESELPEEEILIESTIKHELYEPRTSNHDIAIIKLARNVKFSKYIRPACLMPLFTQLKSNKAIATGWGLTEAFADHMSDVLQKVDLTIVDSKVCSKLNDDKEIDYTKICAGELKGGKDTCQGDSGGPLQIISEENKCIYFIIGITSYGSTFCGAEESPGVYTRVAAYLDWIEDKVWGS